MSFFKRKLMLGVLALFLLTPTPNKPKNFMDRIATAGSIVLMGLYIYAMWTMLEGDTEEKTLINNIKKNPHIPAHIKRKILTKTAGWGLNKKTYLRFANSLPWVNVRPKFVSYDQAENTLNSTHYGLDNAKKRILEYLVAYQSNPQAKGKVLCLIGGPGVGKTSLVKSIARALERPFALVSTATQEWTLRGHEYTFISAEPGDFSKALCTTQSQHPIILLDEIDKAQNNTQALLEALDPERNTGFLDTFFDFGINLSNVLFIATANNLEKIPQPLRDRMELIQLEAYSFEDKVNIASKYFIPQLTKHANLSPECIQQLIDCVPQIIKFTSRTSDGNDGVRSLRHAIDGLVNKQIFNQTVYGKSIDLTPENIKEYIDPYYTQLRLSEPKDLRTYCNNALRKLDIPLDTFIKIERRIGGLFNWIASSTLVPAYIDWISKYPFIPTMAPEVSLETAAEQLNATHYGLEHVKESVLDYLAGYAASGKKTTKILCFSGAPGVGKTTIAESIALALGRNFTKISFTPSTNLTSTSEHGTEPGELGHALIKAQTSNPLILLDELEKSHPSIQKELLALLDPAQNGAIHDDYLGFEMDLSNVMFIASVNDVEMLPAPLRDRMQIIELDPYSREERITIANNKLIPDIARLMNSTPAGIEKMLSFVEPLVDRFMPFEAGVRALKRSLIIAAEKIARLEQKGVDVATSDLKPEDVIDPYFRSNRLSDPKHPYSYCNQVFKHMFIPPAIFKKIDQKIAAMTLWAGAESLIPLYADTVAKYPFGKMDKVKTSLDYAKKQLDKTHTGIPHVKEMVLDFLAGYIASNQQSTKVLCLNGAPGVGKTTVAESIATALGRKFSKVTFGGLHNLKAEASGGHDNLSGPGPIAKALIDAGSLNPVILLDELEKAPAHLLPQLLEILDPAQNKAFTDRYMGFEMDLSKVMFIASANDMNLLPSSLRDRMQIIEIDPYSRQERITIAKDKLIPEISALMSTSPAGVEKMLSFVEPLVDRFFVFEAGVRALKRSLIIAAEKIARLDEEGLTLESANLTFEDVIDPYFRHNRVSDSKNAMSYCNQLFKTISIPPAIFKKIDQKIAAMTLWAGAESLISIYAETVVKYPFGKIDKTIASVESAQTQLDKTHSGIKHVKTMILDFLAGYIASNQQSTKVLCLTGAPGVGKTTVAESIATALGRKFSKISFSGLQNLSAEASGGHDNLSGPGPIAKALIEAGSLNPVILLDELEKAPAHLLPQLLEILDPAQNKAFTDRYLGFEMDLSKVMFIGSVNDTEKLAWPLQDRMQLVAMPGYTKIERVKIAEEKLLPNIQKLFNLSDQTTAKIKLLIEPLADLFMNWEAGVRVLNRALITAAEKYSHLTLDEANTTTLTYQDIVSAINPEYLHKKLEVETKAPRIGAINALYATAAGNGGVLTAFASVIPFGEGKIIHSSTHGKMEQETNKRILDYLKINHQKYGLTKEMLTTNNFSLTSSSYGESDGNSAGIADTVALISALTKRPVRSEYAVTGAIDMLGNALAVGGYKSKVTGAARQGIKKFILPECARPVIEAQKDEFDGLEINYIKHVDEAVNLLLV